MINPLVNKDEQRLRAFFRITLFIILFYFLVSVPSLISVVWVEYTVRALLVFGLYYVMIRFVDLRPWYESGLILNKTWIKEFLAGIIIAGLVMSLIFVTEYYTSSLDIIGFGWQRNGNTFWLLTLLTFLVQMAAVSYYEEIMARGYLLRNLAEGFSVGTLTPVWGAVIAVIFSSIIFGLMHAGNPNITNLALLNIGVAGVMLALPFIVTGRLAFSIGLHFSWNFCQGGIFGFRVSGMDFRSSIIQIQQSGPKWWTGDSFGPEGGVIGLVGIFLVILFTLLYFRFSGTPIKFSTTFSENFSKKTRNIAETDELT